MFQLSLERQQQLDTAYLLYFPELDADEAYVTTYLADLAYVLDDIPEVFHATILEGTLYENKQVYQDYLRWCEQVITEHQQRAEDTYRDRTNVVEKLSVSGAAVFLDTLHDGEIIHSERKDGNVRLLLDMQGGFTPKAIVELTFIDVIENGELDRYYVYDELIETETGFGLRVLSGAPYVEWTAFFKDVIACFMYRPKPYAERKLGITWNEYSAQLNKAIRYFIVEQYKIVEIDVAGVEERADGIYAGNLVLGKSTDEAIQRLYCDTYEDPYAHFSEMVPIEELEQAALSEDPVLRVRAFNTMFEQGQDVATIVNRVLRVIVVEEQDEMLLETIAAHFDKLGLLDDDVKSRWM